jgi:ribosomal protein S18 acetylase RimI-like enzyme
MAKAASDIVLRKTVGNSDKTAAHLMSILFPNSRQIIKEGDVMLVAEYNGKPAGFCHFRIKGKKCYIAGLGVLPEFRNIGIGSLLFQSALDEIDAAGVQETVLKVRALNPASNLYVKFGFFERVAGETLLLERKRPS